MNLTKAIMIKFNQNFIGIGNDLVEIKRIEESISTLGDRFFNRLFTPQEISYCQSRAQPAIHFAGRFAAKESIAKALGTGFGGHLKWVDLEILPDNLGKPIVYFLGDLKALYPSYVVSLSISHTKELAFAVAILFDLKN